MCDYSNRLYKKQQAVLVYIVRSKLQDMEWDLQEFLSLASSAGIHVLDTLFSKKKSINSKYFIGKGKLLELSYMINNSSASIILFNCTLSPNQERNLVHFLKCKILDKNQLILSIFAQRARTYEGKLQVRLAQLRYLNSRLIHEWSHLERQTGGIGIRGGPGEMQLESDRRVLRRKIVQILSDLKKIENQREQNRRYRIKIGVPVVSLIGYTNAGKSTLFNVMTLSNVHTEEKLFVTLDPTFRRIVSDKKPDVILIDTVGFIKDLPKDLISAFKATLQEIAKSTLLLHIVDISNKKSEQNIDVVNSILDEIHVCDIPVLVVMNKIDQMQKIEPRIDRNDEGLPVQVWISAQQGLGICLLRQAIYELLPNNDHLIRYTLRIPGDSDLCQHLFRLKVIERFHQESGSFMRLTVRLSSKDWNDLEKHYKLLSNYII